MKPRDNRPDPPRVHGIHAPAPRLTCAGAAIAAFAVSLPGGALIWLIGLLI